MFDLSIILMYGSLERGKQGELERSKAKLFMNFPTVNLLI